MTDDEVKAAKARMVAVGDRIQAFMMGDRPWSAVIVVYRMWELLNEVGAQSFIDEKGKEKADSGPAGTA